MLLLGAIIVAGLFLYFYLNGAKEKKNHEGYMAAGALDHLDSLDSRYELIQSPDQAVPAEHFADLVDAGDQARMVQQPVGADYVRPLERLERLHTDAKLPLTAAHLPAYNVDVANPSTYAFAVQAPRVVLKNRQAMQADMVRGDIPIRYHPDVALIGKSSLGRDSLRLDGTFSDQFRHLYDKLTGRSYKNLPLQVATQGTVMDYIQ